MKENHNLGKWLAGEMTAIELEAFKKSSEYSTYTKIKDFSGQLTPPSFDIDATYQKVLRSKKGTTVFLLQNNWLWKIAAVFTLFIGIGLLYSNLSSTTQMAEAGARNSFLLPDHSQVVLNSVSELTYKKSNWDNNRECKLLGEAFFKVAKGKTFDIKTTSGTVTVVGTQFNVKSRKNRFEVECYEGKVKVQFDGKMIFLTKGQNIVVQNGKQIDALKLNQSQPNWMNREMKFNSENLVDVVAEIERQYNITVELKTISTDQKFTGILPTDNIDIAMKIISTTYHLEQTKTDKKLILQSNDNKSL
ncbi:FecR family protein [Flavobacterium gillisiae]|uniref:FecR family protein n=1 Tax=Flavobacterium gillisiae TaxID=150146 RepID=A0A1H4EZF0_9FLAO|nr:FecR family protein [Flavobacterium gillisiae]SEA90259.1 FecR family protein [Flavobacterium gillisiae]